MIRFVNAKINLGLKILFKRPDGYHELSTVFYPIGLYNGTPENPEPFCDILEVTPLGKEYSQDSYQFSGLPIDCPLEKNLVFKAMAAFRHELEKLDKTAGHYHIHLEKFIPDGAGLGGGSADASFTLKILNELEDEPFTPRELKDIAAGIGADCPFFIENRPVAASGIGEIMSSLDLNLSGKWALVVKPHLSISTREAFEGLNLSSRDSAGNERTERCVYPESLISLPIEKWRSAELQNDFEFSLFPKYPVLSRIKTALYECGAIYASLTGSGAALYGIWDSRDDVRNALEELSGSFADGTVSNPFFAICRL